MIGPVGRCRASRLLLVRPGMVVMLAPTLGGAHLCRRRSRSGSRRCIALGLLPSVARAAAAIDDAQRSAVVIARELRHRLALAFAVRALSRRRRVRRAPEPAIRSASRTAPRSTRRAASQRQLDAGLALRDDRDADVLRHQRPPRHRCGRSRRHTPGCRSALGGGQRVAASTIVRDNPGARLRRRRAAGRARSSSCCSSSSCAIGLDLARVRRRLSFMVDRLPAAHRSSACSSSARRVHRHGVVRP